MNALAIVSGITALCFADVPPTADGKGTPAQVAAFVDQLGSKRYAEREAASRALDALGPQALAALRQAQQSDSPEVRRRAQKLVQGIERRLEAAPLLTPTRVRLVYKDTPLPEALADLEKRTGLSVRLEGDAAKFAARKLTLDTGEVPLWDAFFLFCRRAGLNEIVPPAGPNGAAGRGGGMSVTIVGGGAAPAARDIMKPPAPEKPLPLVLTDGEPLAPMFLAGSVRFRALRADPALVAVRKPGEVLVELEATVEPGLRWRHVIGVNFEKVVDDQGQVRKGELIPALPKAPAAQRGVVIINGQVIEPPDDAPGAEPRQLPLRFAAAAKPARLLQEVKGTVTALMQSATQDLISVYDILKAVGKRFEGPQGSAVLVAGVTRQENGGIRLRIEVAAMPDRIADGTAGTAFNQAIIINGKRLGEKEETLSAQNFVLLDAKGKPFRVTTAVNTNKRQGAVQEYELTYEPNAGQGAPLWFVYRDRRSAIIDIPFSFKDVPLP
jgi:hypothetical protein